MIALIFIAIAGVVAYGLWHSGAFGRKLAEAPLKRVADLTPGDNARVKGRAEKLQDHLVAPLTGRTCLAYVVVVEEYVSNGKSGSWRQRLREQKGVRFAINDGSGTCWLDAAHASVELHIDHQTKSGTFDAPNPIEQAFLDRHNFAGEGWVFNKSLRYKESVIETGEAVVARGPCLGESDPSLRPTAESAYRDGPPQRMLLTGNQDNPVMLSDVEKHVNRQ